MRRIRLAALVFVATLVALELVLQAGALALWWIGKPPPAAAPPNAEVVLCVGDSWTQGMGTSDATKFSYPAVLQTLLRSSTGKQWTVVNGGQAGQNSRDVLARLPAQLRDSRPRIVCVLVGRNDYWTLPEEMTELIAEDPASYRFRWRIPRLFAWAMAALADRGGNAGAAASTPKELAEWMPKPVTWPNPYPAEPREWNPSPLAGKGIADGWRLAEAGDFAGAIAAFGRVHQENKEDPNALWGLVHCCLKAGQRDVANGHLASLEALWAAKQTYWVGRDLCSAYLAVTRSSDCIVVAKKLLMAYPEDPQLWQSKAQAEFYVGDQAAAVSIRECLRRWPVTWAFDMEYQVLAKQGDIEAAVGSIFQGYVATNDASWARRWLASALSRHDMPAAKILSLLQAFNCPPDVHRRLDFVVHELIRQQDGVEAARIHSAHLRKIEQLVRTSGAVPVFLSYPFPEEDAQFGRPLRTVAQELGVRSIDVTAEIAKRLGSRSVRELSSPDGHVVDEGYHIMAECVAAGLAPVLDSLR